MRRTMGIAGRFAAFAALGAWGVVLATWGPACGGESVAPTCEARSCCVCPDDYCPKPLPCVPCAPRGKCDNYCRKPLPCAPCVGGYCGPDDYCPKPCNFYLPPCWPAWYTCGAW